MRIVMMGTGAFAVPTFHQLSTSDHEVVAMVTRPEKPLRGKRKAPPNPMREAAATEGTPVFAPPTVNSDEARRQIAGLRPDLLVVCDFGEILKPETLAVARLGGVNLHGSLLPKYRGAAPVQWAIYHGEEETGNTVIHMTAGLDAGPCLAQCRTPIDPEETAGELEARLAEMGGPLVCGVVDALAAGRAEPIPQNVQRATKAPRLKKIDGRIDWSRTAVEIKNQVRAMQPWPSAYTFWRAEGREPLRLILRRVAVQQAAGEAAVGTVTSVDRRLLVATGSGTLSLEEVQPASKRVMAVDEFLRGYPLEVGHVLG